ncbi:tyrosine-type recombinase/integrase [Vibrio renipiscarius]|uniref:tyrosine-type recombinase/integrase n=1 Tax=Vibrio renipiscarius TaxID=1461322 RepID=UPI00069C1E55|nr:site-specific integrase [Vibrio renipiscarius]
MGKIGVQARKESRDKHIENVKNKARQLFEKSFPNPSVVPSSAAFIKKWQVYLNDIGLVFGGLGDYRRAFNQGVTTVRNYNEQYQWGIQPPSHIVTNKPIAQLRTLTWLKRAWQVNTLYKQWHKQLINLEPPHSRDMAHRDLLLSFIFHSGHCVPEIVKAFSDRLFTTPLRLQTWNEQPFMTITIDNPAYNTNVTDSEAAITQFCCYLHPVTLGLIRHWKKWQGVEGNPPPKDWNALMYLLAGPLNTMTSAQFCSAAAYTCEQHDGVELSQALVEYQIGHNKSYSLPLDNLARLHRPTVTRLNTSLSYFPVTTAKSIRSPLPNYPQMEAYPAIKACFKKTGVKELSKTIVSDRLNRLILALEAQKQTDTLVLVSWYRHKLKSCAVNSVRSYHANLSRNWLYLSAKYPLHQLSSENLESLYIEAIEGQASAKAQRYFASRLKDVHQFAVTHFQYAKVSSQYLHADPTQSHTRAGFVDEGLFCALMNAIDRITDLNDADKLCLMALCITSYRCGLRLSELRKLRIKDIEKSTVGWLQIRESQYGSNKTASSLRKVPFFPLLLEDETEIVEQFYRLKLEQTEEHANYPFFTIGSELKLPITSLQISALVGGLLKSLSGLDYLVFHHLRHSCLSRMQLLLELGDDVTEFPSLTAYPINQIHKIKHLVFGRSLRNGYDQIAAFAGHESAAMTFQHYFHFSDWIVARKLLNANFNLTKAQTVRLGINSRANIRLQKHVEGKQESLDYLSRKLQVKVLSNPIVDGCDPVTYSYHPSTEILSIPICYQAISLYEQGFQHEDICNRLRIKEQTLSDWIARAKAIKALTVTNAGKVTSRHFSHARSDKLLPAKLKSEQEIVLLNQYIASIKQHYPANRDAFKQIINYVLHHSSVSRSGIYFNSPQELQSFIKTSWLFIPKSHWRAMTHFMNASTQKDEWALSLKGIKQVVERKQTGRSKKSYGAVRLELIDPHHKHTGKTEKQKRSSPTLMYLFHMMGIMMSIV